MPLKAFIEELDFLSNFYPCKIELWGEMFSCSEQAFMYCKSLEPDYRRELMSLKNPGDMKRLGRTVMVIPGWDRARLGYMMEVLLAKFEQNPILMKRLLAVEGPIVEYNYWHDNFWGVCICKKCGRDGENNLGFCLESIRRSNAD